MLEPRRIVWPGPVTAWTDRSGRVNGLDAYYFSYRARSDLSSAVVVLEEFRMAMSVLIT